MPNGYGTLVCVSIDVLFAGVAVADFEAAVPWYERLFGRAADIVVNDDEVMWHLTSGGWLYVVRDQDNAGHGLVAVAVTNLDTTLAALESRGIPTPAIESVGDGGRKARIVDTEGNVVAFIQVASQDS
jgi:predicted enzyme related to lactoylglutathione lyase